jgi:L-asparaginase
MRKGARVEDAVRASLAELADLKNGLLGGVTVHAIDAAGGHFVGAVRGKPRTYYLWTPDADIRTLSAPVI